jgi:DNA-binding transcriptional ArsR family regulator
MTFQDFITLLEVKGLKPRQLANGQWQAHCPAHDDAEPSLSVTESYGRILLHCFAGCAVDAICNALGITLKDLRTDQDLERRVTFEVRDPNGALVALHERIERNGKKTFVWRHPDGRKAQGDLKVADLPLYGVHRLQSAEFVVIVEGEKCADALWSVGIPAVATYGATCDPADEPLRQVIERVQTIYLWADNDNAGRKHMERIGKRLLELGATDVRWVEWHDAPEKGDAADAVAQRVDLHALLEAAKPFEPPEEAPQNGSTPPISSQTAQCPFCQLSDAELFERARPVLDAENPLQAAVERVSQTFGVVGENDNLQLLLLALTTRIFPQPVNVLVVGGTGQGKSFLTDAACATLPPCCHRRIVGASARALLFHPLAKGTVLQWLELPELGGDTIAATILRSILWQAPQETATDYLFVEWTPKGARRRSVQMPRQVALITTKVDLPKDDQLLSRFLVMEVRESPDKRKAVLNALAASFNGVQSSPTDDALEPVRAFAEWLARFKVRVTIPYAYVLADLFAELPASERDFRDFATLLKLVAACALWNLPKRQHAFNGDNLQVTANLDDYATVYRLLLPVWGKPRSAALSEAERKVAEALFAFAQDHPPTAEELAQALGLAKRTVERHLRSLELKGFAERGDKREVAGIGRKAYEWKPVGDLSALTPTLPTPEQVASRWQPEPPKPDPISDICDNSRQCPLSLIEREKPQQILGFSAPDPISDICDTGDLTISDDSDSETTVRKLSDIFEAGAASPIGKENDVANVANSKTPSFTKENLRHSPLSLNVANVANASPTEPQKPDKSLPIDPDSGLEVKVVCPTCGSWRRVPPDALMLADPRCSTCGSVMKPEPEDNGERYIDTEDWVASFLEGSNEPVVFDLETDEVIPVADLPPLPTQEAVCPRCGHREHAIPTGLFPPLCPACRSPMQWLDDPPPTDPDPLSLAVARLADLSDQFSDAKKEGGQP